MSGWASASAQNAEHTSPAAEIIQRANGEAVGAWKKSNSCNAVVNICGETLINAETGEVAVFAGQIAGAFSKTGVGAEIRRAGSATTLSRKSGG